MNLAGEETSSISSDKNDEDGTATKLIHHKTLLEKKINMQDDPESSLYQFIILLGIIIVMIVMALLIYYLLQCLSNRVAATAGQLRQIRQNKVISTKKVTPWGNEAASSDTES